MTTTTTTTNASIFASTRRGSGLRWHKSVRSGDLLVDDLVGPLVPVVTDGVTQTGGGDGGPLETTLSGLRQGLVVGEALGLRRALGGVLLRLTQHLGLHL